MYFLILTILVLIIFTILGIGTKCYLNIKNNKLQIVTATNVFLVAGIICGWIFLTLGILSYIKENSWGLCYLFLAFVWLGLFLVYGWFGMITIYDDKGFSRGWLPLQKKYYTYDQFTAVKITMNGREFLVGKKKIAFDYRIMDCYEFIGYASLRYKHIKVKDLPIDKSIPSWDIFNGHVEEPESFVFIIVMFLVIGLAFPAWLIYDAYDYVTEDETAYIEVSLDNYYIEENHMILESDELIYDFEILRYEVYDNAIPKILNAIDNGKPLGLYVLNYREAYNENLRFEVCSVKDWQGNVIISFDEMNEEDKEFSMIYLPIAGIILGFILLFCASIVIVGRYPHKFSKRVQRWIFQDGYLH